jgi:hypothetical protein
MLKPAVATALLLAAVLTGCSSTAAPEKPAPAPGRTTARSASPTPAPAADGQTPTPLAVLCTDLEGDGAPADILTAAISQTATTVTVTVTVKFSKPVPNDVGITTFFNNADGNGGGIFQALWTDGTPTVTTQSNATARVSTVSAAPVVSDGGTTIETVFPAALVNPLQEGWVWKVTSSTGAVDADSCSVPAA